MNRTRPSEYPKSGWYWHAHHEVLCEYVWDVDERWNYIVANKPEEEIGTRLRWFRPVAGEIPARLARARVECDRAWSEYNKARAEYDKEGSERYRAWSEYDKARSACDKAWDECSMALTECSMALTEYDKALAEALPEMEALHAIECPGCPWDGRTLFPKKI